MEKDDISIVLFHQKCIFTSNYYFNNIILRVSLKGD
jgi:hypothetical protein